MKKTGNDKSNDNRVILMPYIPVCKNGSEPEEKIKDLISLLNSDIELYSVYLDIKRKIYERTHHLCPKCGSNNITHTCVAYLPKQQGNTLKEWVDSYEYKDLNYCTCTCGWHGCYDDLVDN